MDSCEEQVIIACGLYFISDEGNLAKPKYWIHNIF